MDPKISIIVPIYNVERYLSRSIESIQKQTLKDIEIILVNDGSTDNSLSICKVYQKRDKRIQIIDKPNGGVSSARNAGLVVAKGEYVGFIDPDDWIEPEMYEKLYNQVKKVDADVCMCNYVIEKNGESIPNLLKIKQNVLEGKEIVHHIITELIGSSSLNSHSQTTMGSVWRLIIKREFINHNNFRFHVEIPLMEDLIFCIQVLLKSKRVSINEGAYYHYFIYSNSAATSYRNDMIKIQKTVYQTLENLVMEENVYQIVEQRMNVRYVRMCIGAIVNEIREENTKKLTDKIAFIKELCNDKKLKTILKTIDTKGYTLRKKMILISLQYEQVLFLYFYYSFLSKIRDKIK